MRYKTGFLFFAVSLYILGCTAVLGNIRVDVIPPGNSSKITKIAVFPFDVNSYYGNDGQHQANAFSNELRRLGYDCVDGKTMERAFKEAGLEPYMPVTSVTAIMIGKILGVQGVVLGKNNAVPSPIIIHSNYSIKLVDVATQKDVWNIEAQDTNFREMANRLNAELYRSGNK